MAKKFFYNKVYNTKRTIINAIIIGVCIIGIIVCFIVTSNFQGESHQQSSGEVSIKNEVTVETNEEFTKEIFFSKIDSNVNLDDIDLTFGLDYDITKVGSYTATLTINGEKYPVTLNVVDTLKPELSLKDLNVEEGKKYVAQDFVESCADNSKKECTISFYKDAMDEEGHAINYSNYTKPGKYEIKISATDESGNQIVKDATLIIGKVEVTPSEPEKEDPPVTTTCKYGNNVYDTNKYLIAIDITNNKCAVSLDLYKDGTTTKEINKLMETETTRIKKDVEALNLTGTLALNRKVTAVINTTGNGIVGYELKMTVTITNKNKSDKIVEYKVNKNGKRVFITNPHNLSK